MISKHEICMPDAWRSVSEELAQHIAQGRNIVLLEGDLGAGKTTLVKDFVRLTAHGEEADSPTFSIVNAYETDEATIYHFDLYRLNTTEEVEDIGFWDYIESGSPCFIEWPDKIADILPENQVIRVQIEVNSSLCRDCSISF